MKPLTAEAALRRRCQVILAGQRRRARADGKVLAYDLESLVRLADQDICTYCRAPAALDFQIDHLCPTSRNGAHDLFNLCICCQRCNRLKGNLTADEFIRLRKFLESLPPAASDGLMRRLLRGAVVYTGSRRKKT